jgi:hypothetical protein
MLPGQIWGPVTTLPSCRHAPSARRNASGIPRWRWRVQRRFSSPGVQATPEVAFLCHGQLAQTAKVPFWAFMAGVQRGGARRSGAAAHDVGHGVVGHRLSLGHTLGCAGLNLAFTHVACDTPARGNLPVAGGATRWCGDARGPLQKFHGATAGSWFKHFIARQWRAHGHDSPRSYTLSQGGSSATRWPAQARIKAARLDATGTTLGCAPSSQERDQGGR